MSEDATTRALASRPGWWREGNSLVRELRFRDFDEAMSFVDRVAATAVDYGRRPDMCISSGRVRLSIANVHHAGLTRAELRLLSKVDAALEEHTVSA